MHGDEHVAELILTLKRIKDERHLTLQQICDFTEANGEAVSLTTVKKVFAEGSEREHFNYNLSIRPIARALNNVQEKDSGSAVLDALRATIRLKDDIIEDKEEELRNVKEAADRKIEFLKNQIRLKDERIDKLLALVSKQ